VGIQEVDRQHKILFGIINKLHSCVMNNTGKGSVSLIFEQLADYIVFQFRYEEKLMETNYWFDIEHHKTLHQDFVNKIFKFQSRLNESGDSSAISKDVLAYLKYWLVNHVMTVDKSTFERPIFKEIQIPIDEPHFEY
jgi:hemerythrin-like metal-binding protein